MTDYLKSHAKKLFQLGYPIIPIGKGKKHPTGKYAKGWQKIEASPKLAKSWINNSDWTGVGILSAKVPAIDIDIYDEATVEIVLEYLEEKGLYDFDSIRRTGEHPKVLIPFRLEDDDSGFHKIQSSVYIDDFGTENKIEVLGIGQQFVAYHIHPDTGEPYHYNGGSELADVAYDDLPTLNAYQAKELVDWFEKELIPELGWEKKKGKNRQDSKPIKNDIDVLDNVVPPLEIGDLKVVKTLEGIDPDCDYDTWSSIGMALWHQYNGGNTGYRLFGVWSSRGKKFQKGDVNKIKWASFEPDYSRKPITFAFALSLVDPDEEHKEIPALRKFIEEDDTEPDDSEPPIDKDRQGDFILPKIGTKGRKKLDKYLSKYILVGHKQLVIDKSKPPYQQAMDLKDFQTMKGNEMIEVLKPLKTDPDNTKWVSLSSLWLTNKERSTVTGFRYSPGKERFFKDDTNTKYANSFAFPDHERIAKRVDVDYEDTDRLNTFFEHIDYVFPNVEERKWFLQWIAFTIQVPHKRCPIAPIHVARTKGIGRSWILRAITKMFGPENVNTVDIEQIIGENTQFNDHLVDCKVIACEELRIGDGKDRYKVENTLKSDITDSRKQIRRKYGTQLTEDIFGNFLFFTNYSDAIQIAPDERRYNVFSGPAEKNTSEYYENLMLWLDDYKDKDAVDGNIAQLFNFFSNLDISDFDVSSPMNTPARTAMINMSKSDTEHLYDAVISKLGEKVLTAADIHQEISTLEGFSHESLDLSRLGGVLRQRATSLGRVTVKGTQYKLWSLDNVNYSSEEAAQLYAVYLETKFDEDFGDFDDSS